jgi:hypothetical protein
MKIILTESEKKEILKLYGIILEQQSIVYVASTDKTPMYNFPNKNVKSSNQQNGGLPGDPKMECYLFQTTLADIKKRAMGEQSQYFEGFKPTTQQACSDKKELVDYLRIGDTVLQGGGTKEFDLTDPNAVVVASHNGLLALLRIMDAIKRTPGGNSAKVEMATVDTRTSGFEVVSPKKAYQIGRIMDTVIDLTAISMVSGYNLVNSPYKGSNLFKNNLYLVMADWGKFPKTGPNPPTTEQIANALIKYMDGQIRRVLTTEEDSKKDEFIRDFKLTNYIGADNLTNLISSSYNKTVGEVQSSLNGVLNLIRPAYVKMYADFTRKYYPDNSNKLVEMMNSKLNDKPTSNLKDQVALYSKTDITLDLSQTQSVQNAATKTVQSREIGK